MVDLATVKTAIETVQARDGGTLLRWLQGMMRGATEEQLNQAERFVRAYVDRVPDSLARLEADVQLGGLNQLLEPTVRRLARYVIDPADAVSEGTYGLVGLLNDAFVVNGLTELLYGAGQETEHQRLVAQLREDNRRARFLLGSQAIRLDPMIAQAMQLLKQDYLSAPAVTPPYVKIDLRLSGTWMHSHSVSSESYGSSLDASFYTYRVFARNARFAETSEQFARSEQRDLGGDTTGLTNMDFATKQVSADKRGWWEVDGKVLTFHWDIGLVTQIAYDFYNGDLYFGRGIDSWVRIG
ncbi:MAG: hypothetical protein FJ315_02265 [SAR202 cluster bacterium]|nr:hypothetical protein [SAR202 cluster bacterium]